MLAHVQPNFNGLVFQVSVWISEITHHRKFLHIHEHPKLIYNLYSYFNNQFHWKQQKRVCDCIYNFETMQLLYLLNFICCSAISFWARSINQYKSVIHFKSAETCYICHESLGSICISLRSMVKLLLVWVNQNYTYSKGTLHKWMLNIGQPEIVLLWYKSLKNHFKLISTQQFL